MHSSPESKRRALSTARQKALHGKQRYRCENIKDLQRKYWPAGVMQRIDKATNPQRHRYLLEVGLQTYLD